MTTIHTPKYTNFKPAIRALIRTADLQPDLETLYPLKEYHPAAYRTDDGENTFPKRCRNVAAQWTGEIRQPLEGEWFLSGEILQARFAKFDMDETFPIVQIVEYVETITHTVKELNPKIKRH